MLRFPSNRSPRADGARRNTNRRTIQAGVKPAFLLLPDPASIEDHIPRPHLNRNLDLRGG
jgi:hypothetical protein